jgi:hypothetical protein
LGSGIKLLTGRIGEVQASRQFDYQRGGRLMTAEVNAANGFITALFAINNRQ